MERPALAVDETCSLHHILTSRSMLEFDPDKSASGPLIIECMSTALSSKLGSKLTSEGDKPSDPLKSGVDVSAVVVVSTTVISRCAASPIAYM